MLLRTTTLALFLIFCVGASFSKVIDESRLDTCLVQVLYERVRVTDTLDCENNHKENLLTLRAGKDAAAFYSPRRKSHDSISVRDFSAVAALFSDTDAFRSFSEEEQEVVFRLKKEGKVIVDDSYDATSWRYEEPLQTPEWTITDSVTTIDGLQCVMAQTHFRGRDWTAWFTPEIPIGEGPWKLCGLPGLILRAADSRGHYTYTAKAIATNPGGWVDYFNYEDRVKTNRIDGLVTKRKIFQKSAGSMMALRAIGGKIAENAKKMKKPVKNYDFEETDYPHK